MNQVLSLYRDSTWFIHSEVIRAHSNVIQVKLESRFLEWIWNVIQTTFLSDDRMTEWCRNERCLRIQYFCTLPKTPSFLVIWSFSVSFEWPGMKITMERYHSEVIPFIFTPFLSLSSFQNAVGMTEWGWNDGYFWSKAKPLILKSQSFHRHLVILSQNPMHQKSFHSFEVILKFNSQITPLTLYSFRRKFFSVRMRLEWLWNDLWMNESGAVSI